MLQPKFKESIEVDQFDMNRSIPGLAAGLFRKSSRRDEQANFPIASDDPSERSNIFT